MAPPKPADLNALMWAIRDRVGPPPFGWVEIARTMQRGTFFSWRDRLHAMGFALARQTVTDGVQQYKRVAVAVADQKRVDTWLAEQRSNFERLNK